MLTFVIWAIAAILALLILGAMLEGLGIALGAGALAGFSVYRLVKRSWAEAHGTKAKVEFAVMAALGLFGAVSALTELARWLFT